MRASHTDPVIGRVVGAYRVLGRLGVDGVAALYVAEHLHLDRKVALRLLGPEVSWGAGSLDRFLADARRLSSVRQENVLEIVDLGETGDGQVFLVLELPEGPTLDQAIAERGAMSAARARLVGVQIGTALNAVAEVALSNRDLSPRQIFLTTRGDRRDVVKVDFSAVGLFAAKSSRAQDDVHVLGGLLYEMIVGWPPVAKPGEAPEDPLLSRPDLDVPPDLDALIMRALDPNPSRRWPDLLAMLQMLAAGGIRASGSTAILGAAVHPAMETGRDTGDRMTTVPPAAAPPRRAKRVLISGAVVAAVAGLALTLRLSGGAGLGHAPEKPGSALAPSAGVAAANGSSPPSAPVVAAVEPVARSAVSVPTPSVQPLSPVARSPIVESVGRGVPAASGIPPMLAAPTSPVRVSVQPGTGPLRLLAAAGGAGGVPRPPLRLARAETGAGGASGRAPAATLTDDNGGALAGLEPGASDVAGTTSAAPAVAADDACAVTLGSRPWSEVWIDGRKAGFTPLVDYPIDCGAHDVTWRSLELGAEKKMSVVVAAGKPFRKTVDLTGKDGHVTTTALAAGEPAVGGGLRTASAVAGGCQVTLGSRPWSEVWIDGKRAGVTPLVEYRLPCGKHEVIFRGGSVNAERREVVVLQSGRTIKKVVTLEEEP